MQLNHIIIGAGRSGTTSLVAYLKQHSKINFSSIKEVTYFSVDDHYQRGASFLNSFFEEKDGVVNSTADTYLLMDKTAPKRMAEYNPKMKLTVILRAPEERTYSNYNFSVNHGYIHKSISLLESQKLEESILQNGDIIQQNNHCNFEGSLYHKHLNYWLQYFPKEQLFICTTNELKENPVGLMIDYFQFLGLEEMKVKELPPQHKAAGVKNKSLNKFLVNREHPIRKLISKPLQISFLRNIILNSNVVEKIKSSNKEEMSYREMTKEENEFCQRYFAADLQKLKEEFGIRFDN